MNFNIVTNSEYCDLVMRSLLHENVILYYSHIPTAAISLLLGLFIFLKNRKNLSGKLFFIVTALFALWSLFDLILWSSPDSRKTMFFWSLINFLENMVSCFTLYFVYVFLERKDAALKYKMFFASLFLPFLFLMPTAYNITGFNGVLCEAQQGMLINYFYFLEGVFFLALLGYIVKKIVRTHGEKRKQAIYLALGSVFFLLSFSGANIAGSIASVINPDNPDNWKILQYGLFGMPVFTAFLAYLIVRYKAFDIKLIGAQGLVATQFILIGSMLTFVQSATNYILVGTTLIITLGAGWILIRSVEKEVKRKEELQRLSERLAVANQELKRLDTAKSEFISIASHQLRTPLTAIKGYASLLLEGSYGKVSAPIQDTLEKIYAINGRLVQLVEDLLSISRIEAGRIQYNFTPTHIEPLVAELIDMFSLTAKEKNLELKMRLPRQVLPQLTIDSSKIKEVISNLIDNALKYTTKGSVTVTVESGENVARIIVSDTGIGIRPEDKGKLFGKFVRTEETMKLFVSGTGLGLYVGKNFVEAHGGKIWAESDGHNQGSRFIIELPFINPKIKVGISE